jgi:hypothetical protein
MQLTFAILSRQTKRLMQKIKQLERQNAELEKKLKGFLSATLHVMSIWQLDTGIEEVVRYWKMTLYIIINYPRVMRKSYYCRDKLSRNLKSRK